MASALELFLVASLTGGNTPVACDTDPTSYTAGNVTTATQITRAWPALPSTPAAGTVYQLSTEFTGTWEAQAMAFCVAVNGSWTQLNPAVGAGSFTAGSVIAGWLQLQVRVLSATSARFALGGAVGQTASSVTPSTGVLPLAPLSQTLAVAAGSTVTLGVLFGASAAGQGIASYGSTLLTIGSLA